MYYGVQHGTGPHCQGRLRTSQPRWSEQCTAPNPNLSIGHSYQKGKCSSEKTYCCKTASCLRINVPARHLLDLHMAYLYPVLDTRGLYLCRYGVGVLVQHMAMLKSTQRFGPYSFGPSVCCLGLLIAKEFPPTDFASFADMRVVATAHVEAFERPEAGGHSFLVEIISAQ